MVSFLKKGNISSPGVLTTGPRFLGLLDLSPQPPEWSLVRALPLFFVRLFLGWIDHRKSTRIFAGFFSHGHSPASTGGVSTGVGGRGGRVKLGRAFFFGAGVGFFSALNF